MPVSLATSVKLVYFASYLVFPVFYNMFKLRNRLQSDCETGSQN